MCTELAITGSVRRSRRSPSESSLSTAVPRLPIGSKTYGSLAISPWSQALQALPPVLARHVSLSETLVGVSSEQSTSWSGCDIGRHHNPPLCDHFRVWRCRNPHDPIQCSSQCRQMKRSIVPFSLVELRDSQRIGNKTRHVSTPSSPLSLQHQHPDVSI